MLAALLIAAAFVGVVLFLIVRQYRAGDRATDQLRNELMASLEPVWRELYAGCDPTREVLEQFASDPRTRVMLFELLLYHRRLHLFPSVFRTPAALAESQLTQWLMHPNELGCPPDELVLSQQVAVPDSKGQSHNWLLFRFRVRPPHEAAADGWMAGVVGPLSATDDDAFPEAPVVWSLFDPYEALPPAQHVLRCCRQVSYKPYTHARRADGGA